MWKNEEEPPQLVVDNCDHEISLEQRFSKHDPRRCELERLPTVCLYVFFPYNINTFQRSPQQPSRLHRLTDTAQHRKPVPAFLFSWSGSNLMHARKEIATVLPVEAWYWYALRKWENEGEGNESIRKQIRRLSFSRPNIPKYQKASPTPTLSHHHLSSTLSLALTT